jgi:hypothetical protein
MLSGLDSFGESKMAHCWADKAGYLRETFGDNSQEYIDSYFEESASCMLAADHSGDHKWTPDSELVITFQGPQGH